jgi:anti-anti-sigma factor
MAPFRRLIVERQGDVTLVRFQDRKIVGEAEIQEIGRELYQLVDQEKGLRLLLDFEDVQFLSSAALGKLISLDRRVRAADGILKLCSIRPEIHEVFALTHLTQLFDIYDDRSQALAAFSK